MNGYVCGSVHYYLCEQFLQVQIKGNMERKEEPSIFYMAPLLYFSVMPLFNGNLFSDLLTQKDANRGRLGAKNRMS